MDYNTSGFPVHHQLLELAKTHVNQVGDAIQHLIICCPLLVPSVFPSIRVFSCESVLCIKWPKYWSFSSSIRPSNEYSGLISFRIDWFDQFALQGTLKSLLQHHTLKASILQRSAFFMVQLSHPYMTTGKTMALTIQAFVGKVTSLLLNISMWFSRQRYWSGLPFPSPVVHFSILALRTPWTAWKVKHYYLLITTS